MSNRADNSNQTWAGLVVDSPRCSRDEHSLREVIGTDSVLLVVRESDAPVQSIKAIVQSRCSSILTLMGDARSPTLESLLNVAARLSSLRRIVVLRSASAEECTRLRSGGILMLRDCPEIRGALRALVARESGIDRCDQSLEFRPETDEVAQCQFDCQGSALQAVGSDRWTLVPLANEASISGTLAAPVIHRIERPHSDAPPWRIRGVSA